MLYSKAGPTRGGCSRCAAPGPMNITGAHEYQSLKLKWAITPLKS